MANQMVTIRPNSTIQLGSWTVVGAANAHTALSDNTDTTYTQLVTRCSNDPQILKVGFPIPSLPSGSKIYAVGTRLRMQIKVPPDPPPHHFCWHRCRHHRNDFFRGIFFFFIRFLFCERRCPKGPTLIWVTDDLGISTTNPDGQEWTLDDFNDEFDVQLGRDDNNGNTHRVSELYVDVYYNQPPTVTVTGPTGVNADNCRPEITWAYADVESDRQDQYRVKVFNSAQYTATDFDPTADTQVAVADSGWLSGEELAWEVPVDLVNGAYRAYVTVQQVWDGQSPSRSGGLDFTAWTQSVSGAHAPIMVSATFEADRNRIKLEVEPGAASPVTVSYTLEASYDSGITWSNVRNGVQVDASSTPVSTITAVGTAAASSGTNNLTLAVNPTAVGDLMVLCTRIDSVSNTVASVSGGGVTEWIRVADPFVSNSKTFGMWKGVVTSAGASTITITGQSALTTTNTVLAAQQFHADGGANTEWSLDVAGIGVTGASSTQVNYPTITPPSDSAGRMYVGFGWTTNTAQTTGASSGYTAQAILTNNQLIYATSISGTQAPHGTQNTAGVYSTIGVIIAATTANPVTVYDYEAPLNTLAMYRALAFREINSIRYVSADYSNTVSATPVSEEFWLKDPLDSSLNSIMPIAYLGDAVTRQKAQGVFSVIAAGSQANKVVVTGPQYGLEGTFNLVFTEKQASDYWAAFKALDGTGRTLLLQYPNGEQHYIVFGPGTTGDDMQWVWDLSLYNNKYRYYKVQVSYTEVDKPPIT